MTSRDFAYWLQGFFELSDDNLDYLDETQIKLIRAHLNMVFIHEIDPSFPDHQQEALDRAHQDGGIAYDIEVNPLSRSWYDGAIAKC